MWGSQSWLRRTFPGPALAGLKAPIELLELDRALKRLALSEPRQAKVVEMRYFGDMSEEEIAAELNISTRTVKRDWVLARATLYGELEKGELEKGMKKKPKL